MIVAMDVHKRPGARYTINYYYAKGNLKKNKLTFLNLRYLQDQVEVIQKIRIFDIIHHQAIQECYRLVHLNLDVEIYCPVHQDAIVIGKQFAVHIMQLAIN